VVATIPDMPPMAKFLSLKDPEVPAGTTGALTLADDISLKIDY
jgi:hypothetical protein